MWFYSLTKDGITEMKQRSEHIATGKWQLKFSAQIDIFEISCTRVFTQNNKALPWGKSKIFSSANNFAHRDAFTAISKVTYFYLSFYRQKCFLNCIFRHWTTTEVELVQLRKSNWIILNTAVDCYKNIFKNLEIFDKLCWPEKKLHNSTIL